MKTNRRLVPKSVGVSGHPLPVEHNEVAQGCGVSAIPFDASSVRLTVLAPCVRDEVRVQLDGSSGGRHFNELKRNVADHDGGQDNVPLKKTCVRLLYSSPCIVQQPSAALGVSPIAPSVGHLDCVSPIGPSIGWSKRNASSQDDGDNVFHIGPSVPLKRPCEEVHGLRDSLNEQQEVMDAMARDFSRFIVWADSGILQLPDLSGSTYMRYSETHVPYQRRRVRRRISDAITSTTSLDEDQPDL
nr:hypothetical protein [Tanacetum cinerariifolium]